MKTRVRRKKSRVTKKRRIPQRKYHRKAKLSKKIMKGGQEGDRSDTPPPPEEDDDAAIQVVPPPPPPPPPRRLTPPPPAGSPPAAPASAPTAPVEPPAPVTEPAPAPALAPEPAPEPEAEPAPAPAPAAAAPEPAPAAELETTSVSNEELKSFEESIQSKPLKNLVIDYIELTNKHKPKFRSDDPFISSKENILQKKIKELGGMLKVQYQRKENINNENEQEPNNAENVPEEYSKGLAALNKLEYDESTKIREKKMEDVRRQQNAAIEAKQEADKAATERITAIREIEKQKLDEEWKTRSSTMKPSRVNGTRRDQQRLALGENASSRAFTVKKRDSERVPEQKFFVEKSLLTKEPLATLNNSLTQSIFDKYELKQPLSSEENTYLDGLKRSIKTVLENRKTNKDFKNPYTDDDLYTIYKLAKKYTKNTTNLEASFGEDYHKDIMKNAMDEIVKTISALQLTYLDDALTNSIRQKIKTIAELPKELSTEEKNSIEKSNELSTEEKNYIEGLKLSVREVKINQEYELPKELSTEENDDKNYEKLVEGFKSPYTREQLYTIYELAKKYTKKERENLESQRPAIEELVDNIISTIDFTKSTNSLEENYKDSSEKMYETTEDTKKKLSRLSTPEGRNAIYEEASKQLKLKIEESKKEQELKKEKKKITIKTRPHLTTDAEYVNGPSNDAFLGGSRKHYKRGNKKLIRKSLRKYKRVCTSKTRK